MYVVLKNVICLCLSCWINFRSRIYFMSLPLTEHLTISDFGHYLLTHKKDKSAFKIEYLLLLYFQQTPS